MGSRAGGGEWTGGVTGAVAEAGALVWVLRRNGCWWPGQILGADELPEDYAIPPRSTGTPVKLLGRPDGSIDWYDLEKSELVKPFRCGEFDERIENAKVRGHRQNKAYNNEKYGHIDDAIMHAFEIETSCFPNEEPTNQTTECSKEYISSIQDRRKTKMKIISFVTPICKENHKRDNSSLSQLDERPMKSQTLERDAGGYARVAGDVSKPFELENNIEIYDVEVAAYGNYKGHGLPLAFLISKSNGKPIKGYPVTVEIMEDSCPAPSAEVHRRAINHFDYLMESRISVPRQARSLRKPSGSRKILEHDLEKSWGPSTWSFSSYCNLPRKNLERSNRKAVVAEDFPLPIRSTSKPASSTRKMGCFSSFPDSQGESANREPIVVKGSPRPSHSVDDGENSDDEFHSDNGADEFHPLPIRSTSKPASLTRKMGSISSFPDSHGESANKEPLVVKGFPRPNHSDDCGNTADEFHSDNGVDEFHPLPIRSTSKPASSTREMGSLSSFRDSQGDSANREHQVVKVSPRPSDSVDDGENNADELHSTDEFQRDSSTDEFQSDSSTDEYYNDSNADDYVRPTTHFAGSRGSPPFYSPSAISSRSINGNALYLCSACTLCAPVRLGFS